MNALTERISVSVCRFVGVLLYLLLVTTGASASSAQEALFMEVSNAPGLGYTIRVQGYRAGGEFYTDLGAFARALRLASTFDGSKMQIDEAFGTSVTSCVLRQGSGFVVIGSMTGDSGKRVVQLAAAPLILQERMYLPVRQACRMFSLWLGREVRYDASSGRIRASLGDEGAGDALREVGRLREAPTTPLRDSLGGGAANGRSGSRSFAGKTVVDDIRVESRANGVVIRFLASGRKGNASFLKPDTSGVSYLTIDSAGGNIATLSKTYRTGAIRSITPMPIDGGAAQFNILLDTKAFAVRSSSFRYDPVNNEYVVSLMSDADVEAIHRSEKERMIQAQLSQDADKWKLDAVVIDAGHGGKDSGAVGTRGTREKDVVLNIARDLGRFIRQKWPGMKVIYTRQDDTFIPLKERGKIANRYGGKLFVSIHCNSTAGNSRVRGPEVYILGTHKTQASLQVAMLENSVITAEENYRESYRGFSDEYLIMSSMAQSAFASQSTELAQDVLRRLGREGSNNGFGVRQAGFMVLWTPSMPSILVETGYLSNPAEETILRDRQEQTRISYAIFQGIQQFRSGYESRTMAAGYSN